ncbi:MAG: AMP-binding protein [Actinomycetota bacterium]|jgi:crotonobetaine/carnitine-CoA ligase
MTERTAPTVAGRALAEQTFTGAWRRAVERTADAPFLFFERPDSRVLAWSYGEFDQAVSRTARFLAEKGVTRGSAVHLALTNSPTFVAVWLAATGLGAWIVPSDPMGSTAELRGHISRTHPAIGFCATARAAAYRAAVPDLPVVEIDEADGDLAAFGETPLDAWPVPAPLDRAAVMFTSGTTGAPKGVEITQANYAFAGTTMAAACGLAAHHRQLVVLPIFHANAQYYSFASAIGVGASVALMHTFSASGFLTQAARHGATHASLFAAPIRMILARGAAGVPGLKLQHCWYAMNISDDQFETLSSLIGCRPRQLYGMTETIPAVLTDRADAPVASSMGFVTDGCSVSVQRADGTEAAPGEVGEIVVGGTPGVTLFAGYLDDPTTTAAAFRDGWLLTGDRARRDAAGRFTFDGRRADLLKVAGENVSTVEVEQVLSSHPGVLEAAVVGHPDPIRDEVPVGFVVAADPANGPTVDELHAWCGERLTKSKRPRDIILVDELPRTSVGKIRKFLLRDHDIDNPDPISPSSTDRVSVARKEVPA